MRLVPSADAGQDARAPVRMERVSAVGLVLVGIWLASSAHGASGLPLILVGWFLWNAPAQVATRELIQKRLSGRSILPLVRFDFITLDADETIAQAAAHILDAPAQSVYPVLVKGTLLGLVDPAYINAIGREYWGLKMHWAAQRSRTAPILDLDTDALDALAQMDAVKLEGLAVRDGNDALVALVERSAIVRAAVLPT